MESNLSEKTVLVTGASRGIGRAIAQRFAEAGARVILHYNKNNIAAEETLATLPGSEHALIQADISDPEAVCEMVDILNKEQGKIDILVNNAGIYEEADLLELSYEEFREYFSNTINTNLVGVANLSFLISKEMISHGGGKIINISSRGAFRGEPFALPYGASKAGLNSLGQSMAIALASQNIYVYTIAPGFVETDMTTDILEGPRGDAIRNQSPLQRVARPEEIANAAVFLASEDAGYMTGCIIDINGASYLRS
ncbi:MAG: 3-oxoacyl-ACP reductase [Bacteroidetes bacterium]|nr:MAG: 3-oxoacyl-ACP reductase [Bacteroidota bacterium]